MIATNMPTVHFAQVPICRKIGKVATSTPSFRFWRFPGLDVESTTTVSLSDEGRAQLDVPTYGALETRN